MVARLERRGWARREACQEDGRYTNAVLTGEGWAKVAATASGHGGTNGPSWREREVY